MEDFENDTEPRKKKRFRLFDSQRVGKGITKEESDLPPGLKRFFITYRTNFSKLVTVNIMMVLGNFPIIFLILALADYTKIEYMSPLSSLYQNISATITASGEFSPMSLAVLGIEGVQTPSYAMSAVTIAFLAISALTVFTFGIVNVGTAYILRNIAAGEPVFLWSDFIYAIKRNYKQALPFGIFDIIICALIPFNIYSMFQYSGFIYSVILWFNIVIGFIYFSMRFYIYVQMVTFKLSIFKLLKNSLIFSLIGLKRNICAVLGVFLLVFMNVLFLFSTPFLVPIGVAMPLLVLFSNCAFIKVYASYFEIKTIMIDPYADENKTDDGPQDDEPIMIDRG